MRDRVAVIGGAGFIGSRLALSLSSAGHDVTIFDLVEPPADLADGCKYQRLDVRQMDAFRIVPHAYDTVFLMAALLAKGCDEDPLNGWETNVHGMANALCHFVIREGFTRRVVFTSTMAVYASPADCYPITEDCSLGPTDVYGYSKLAGERMLQGAAAAAQASAVILRLFTVYGDGPASRNRGHFIATWMEGLVNGDPLVVHGDGEQTVDLTHVSDVVHACRLAMHMPVAPGECVAMNVASGIETRVAEVAHWIVKQIPGATVIHDRTRATRSVRRIADITRARALLGYEPAIFPQDGIERFVRTNLGGILECSTHDM